MMNGTRVPYFIFKIIHQNSELIIIAGRPSVGKTAFGLNISLNVLKKTRLPVLFFSGLIGYLVDSFLLLNNFRLL